ncbi:SIR2 family protein [Photobacterium sp. GSS17]|uniref:SIR2 family protein n=1 Tax=Photobacterium sp. GSS17 TaxID=3020715 RepID=UPI0023619802|nr:SIR2 family protein [Photobacterium sp. GSS17]
MTTENQFIKIGSAPDVIELTPKEGDSNSFTTVSTSIWGEHGTEISIEKLRQQIEPWLTALFQSEHLNLLIGAGLSTSVQMSATGEPPVGMGWIKDLSVYKAEIDKFAEEAAEKSGRQGGNIEDQIRAISELIRGLEIMTILNPVPPPQQPLDPNPPYRDLKYELTALKKELSRSMGKFSESVSNGEYLIKHAELDKKEETFNYLVSFLMSFASRTATRDRLHIFTTNYDRIIEVGAELAGLRLIDRFVGSLAPVFRSSRLEVDYHYNPPGIRGEPRYLEGVARFTKLHGSLDWHEQDGAIRRFGLPFGAKSVEPFLEAEGHGANGFEQLMIYPNSVKDRETAEYPYVELFRDLAAATSRPNSALVTYGYSFGDEHINRVIEDMLTVPSTHLVIIAFGDPLGRIMRFYSASPRKAQITLLMGTHLGDLKTLVENYLPKPAIDRTSIKMADLLKQRGFLQSDSSAMTGGGAEL